MAAIEFIKKNLKKLIKTFPEASYRYGVTKVNGVPLHMILVENILIDDLEYKNFFVKTFEEFKSLYPENEELLLITRDPVYRKIIIDNLVLSNNKEDLLLLEIRNHGIHGDIKDLPKNIIMEMLEEQTRQGNKLDITVFYNSRSSCKSQGGFSWEESTKGFDFWNNILL